MHVLGEPLVFVDIETNGLNHLRGRVIEVAAIRVERGEIVREFRQLIDPGTPLPQFITQLTGITAQDLEDAPIFMAIADELHEVLDGAIFVAHNVRFDYSFLKQEFKRTGKSFSPRQLCTVRLSRALYPEQRSHKLQNLIDRHGFTVSARHRAYDDAHVLWQFITHVQQHFSPEELEKALASQLKKPSLPKGLPADALSQLPTGPGVYVLEDANGSPIYIGKSVHVRERVASHFMRDHDDVNEFKLSQHVRNITAHATAGELEALLLESRLVKEQLPLYNRQLRRTNRLIVARQHFDKAGYAQIKLEEVTTITPDDLSSVLGVYPRRSKAKEALENLRNTFQLCPKLLGLEKSKGACFLYQLHRCAGACTGEELPLQYNQRLEEAFTHGRIATWPFKGPVLIQEKTSTDFPTKGFVIDQWCIIAEVAQDEYCEPTITALPRLFDLDSYKIVRSFLAHKMARLSIQPLSLHTLQSWGVAP